LPPPSRLSLAHLPTPLEPLERLTAHCGGPTLWIKRDDCTGLAFGGNKARKLELLLAAARDEGADTIVTFGGVQSNHTRSTAAAARRLGMGCHLVLAGHPPAQATGNVLLNQILGARLTFLSLSPEELTPERVDDALAEEEKRCRSMGRKPFRIGPGGSVPLGVLAYRTAYDEVMQQARSRGIRLTHMIVAFGTGGTLAGLVLGNVLAGRPARILGMSVAPAGMPESLGVAPVPELVAGAADLAGESIELRPSDVDIRYEYAGRAYAAPTEEAIEAIRSLARTEGIFVEPVYTAKALAGLTDLCRRGELSRGDDVVFFHTGGTPALFAYSKVLAP